MLKNYSEEIEGLPCSSKEMLSIKLQLEHLDLICILFVLQDQAWVDGCMLKINFMVSHSCMLTLNNLFCKLKVWSKNQKRFVNFSASK